VGVGRVESAQHAPAKVGLAGPLGVLEEPQVRGLRDEDATVVELKAGRTVQLVGEDGAFVGPAGALGEPLMIRPRLERMLAYRHELLSRDLETHARFGDRPPLRVAVSGASGLIGHALVPFLTTGGHTVVRLVRGRAREGEAAWNYEHGRIEAGKLEGLDAVVHLAGENIAARWTVARRRRILDSRAIGTRFLAETLARLRRPPRILVSASAIGIYGNRGQEVLTEASSPLAGPGDFLTEAGREWEAATEPARTFTVGCEISGSRSTGSRDREMPPMRMTIELIIAIITGR